MILWSQIRQKLLFWAVINKHPLVFQLLQLSSLLTCLHPLTIWVASLHLDMSPADSRPVLGDQSGSPHSWQIWDCWKCDGLLDTPWAPLGHDLLRSIRYATDLRAQMLQHAHQLRSQMLPSSACSCPCPPPMALGIVPCLLESADGVPQPEEDLRRQQSKMPTEGTGRHSWLSPTAPPDLEYAWWERLQTLPRSISICCWTAPRRLAGCGWTGTMGLRKNEHVARGEVCVKPPVQELGLSGAHACRNQWGCSWWNSAWHWCVSPHGLVFS